MNYISIQDFLKNTYHHIIDIINNDYILTIRTHHGKVVLLTEEKYICLIENYARKRD